jgi:hypothetical protein
MVILLRIAATPITLVVMLGIFFVEVFVFVELDDGRELPEWLPAVLPTLVLIVLVLAMALFGLRSWVPLELPVWPMLLLVPLWLTDFIEFEEGGALTYGIGVGIVALAMTIRIAAFHWINHRKWSAARRGVPAGR